MGGSSWRLRSVDEASRRSLIEREDHPLDFAPAAEMDDVAEVAATAGAAPGFGYGMVAEILQEIRRLGKGAAAGGVNVVTQENPPACAVQPSYRRIRCEIAALRW
jgi:hypothetical protein